MFFLTDCLVSEKGSALSARLLDTEYCQIGTSTRNGVEKKLQ